MAAPSGPDAPRPHPERGTDDVAAGPELLGTVVSRAGELMVIDFGLLGFWSGDAEPRVPDGLAEPALTEAINRSVDLELVGPDAARAAELVDMVAVNGTFVFDVPAEDTAVRARVEEVRAEHGLDVDLRPLPRMPHRERVRRLLEQRPAGCEVNFTGGGAVAVGGLPPGRELPVRGERMAPGGADEDRWHTVWVEVDDAPVARSVQLGHVFVDEARLLLADPDVLSAWRTDEPLDGLADLMFWGRDEEEVASGLDVGTFEEFGRPVFGWTDLPSPRAQDLARRLYRLRQERDLAFAFDYRPHDDHHRLLSRMRMAPTQAAGVEVAGTPVCGFFTSWGDGAFPVHLDLAADDRLLRVRVELGSPEIVSRQRELEERWFGPPGAAGVTTRAVLEGSPVRWLERGEPLDERDSGWTFYAGTETDEDLSAPGAAVTVSLSEMVRRQPDLEPLLATPPPAAFELGEDHTWHAMEPPPDE